MCKLLLSILILCASSSFGQHANPQLNVIYGEEHIFTIETPDGWINDKAAASKIGLVSFFYSRLDSENKEKSYMFAMGYDKDAQNKNLKSFVAGDLSTFKKKYPNSTHEVIEVGTTGGIINATMYSFDNLTDRFKEEVIYMETEYSILVFSFAAFNQKDYDSYQPIFNNFVGSFSYKGNNPKPYLDWVKSQN
jgi:hypothetical protein